MSKTNKSITKRLRITRTGKIMRMPGGINHFQAKKSRHKQLSNKMQTQMSKRQSEMVIAYLKH